MLNAAQSHRIGEPVRRKEDLRLITGQGRFSDDVNLPQQAYAVMLRSPHAHAQIRSIHTQHALALPGVLTVLTGADMIPDGIQPIPHQPFNTHPADIQMVNTDGSAIFSAPQYPLALHKVRHVGEAVAMVIATSVAAAKDAAEAIDVDYESLPVVTNTVGLGKSLGTYNKA